MLILASFSETGSSREITDPSMTQTGINAAYALVTNVVGTPYSKQYVADLLKGMLMLN